MEALNVSSDNKIYLIKWFFTLCLKESKLIASLMTSGKLFYWARPLCKAWASLVKKKLKSC